MQKHTKVKFWPTPVSGVVYYNLRLEAILQTYERTLFFFRIADSNREKNKVHVMSVFRYSPYQIIEEQYAIEYFGKYIRLLPKKEWMRKEIKHFPATWKIWNTNFINELDKYHALSGYDKKRDKTICEYLIKTSDDWVSVISFEPPQWKVYRNKSLKAIVRHYVDKGL
jgi:hypothetical protein